MGLALPARCVVEAHERQTRRERDRGALQRSLAAELGELSRSATYAGRLEEARRATALLAQSAEEERRRLEATLAELYNVASVIPGRSRGGARTGRRVTNGVAGGPQAIRVRPVLAARNRRSVFHSGQYSET